MTAPRYVVLCVAMWTASVALVGAEPITAVYAVSVHQRFNYQSQSMESFAREFELALTFSGRSIISASAFRTVREYESPSFSATPADLVVAARPSGLATIERRRLTDEWSQSDGGYRRFITAQHAISDETFGNRYFLGVSLGRPSFGVLPSPPELTTLSMLQQLGAGDLDHAFLMTGLAVDESGNFLPDSYQYQGFTKLLRHNLIGEDLPGGAPVPEPGTLLLVGSAAWVAVLRRRRITTKRPD